MKIINRNRKLQISRAPTKTYIGLFTGA